MTSRGSQSSAISRVQKRRTEYSADKLMHAALDLFSKHDFSTVTIKDIAGVSGLNAALIYYYYQNKDDLFRAAIEFAIKKALEQYSELRNSHSEPVYLINEWFNTNLKVAHLIRQLVKIMLDYSGSLNAMPSVEKLIKQFYSVEEGQILADSIQRGIAKGLFKKVDPARTARFVSVHLDGIMVASIIRSNFSIKKSLADLQEILWLYLGYRPS